MVQPPNDTDMKSKLLIAAKRLFASQGFDGTSVRQICEEAGANVALVSYYFGGKENVLFELFHTFFRGEELKERKQEMIHDPVLGLRTLIREVTYYRMQDPQMIQLIQQEIFKNTSRIKQIQEYLLPVWFLLRDILLVGREQGLFHFRSIDNTLFFVMGTMLFHKHAEYFQPLVSEMSTQIEDVVRDNTEFVFRGLGVPNLGRSDGDGNE